NNRERPGCGGGGLYDVQRRGDSETKILDPLMRQGQGGTILMKVYHKEAKQEDEMPCIHCRKSICGAARCDIDVTLCNKDNDEVKADEVCEKDGEGKFTGQPLGTGSGSDPLWVGKGFGPK